MLKYTANPNAKKITDVVNIEESQYDNFQEPFDAFMEDYFEEFKKQMQDLDSPFDSQPFIEIFCRHFDTELKQRIVMIQLILNLYRKMLADHKLNQAERMLQVMAIGKMLGIEPDGEEPQGQADTPDFV